MSGSLSSDKYAHAVAEYNRQARRSDGEQVVPCLATGLAQIRDTLYPRLHQDVERHVGQDSMRMPVSALRAAQQALREINLYEAVEAAEAAARFGYLSTPRPWLAPWLARLLMCEENLDEETQRRLAICQSQKPDQRHCTFLDALARVLPQSVEAPLVLFRLLPLAIQITVAQAFVDQERAAQLRREQIAVLPAIADCPHCHGRVMESVEACPACGNPLWKYEWLRAVD
ncbi:MAG: hypothetical protein JXB10_12265 [Pirellulales bacterium]|nr:hypothetical protein [Pirellulales bacterium]